MLDAERIDIGGSAVAVGDVPGLVHICVNGIEVCHLEVDRLANDETAADQHGGRIRCVVGLVRHQGCRGSEARFQALDFEASLLLRKGAFLGDNQLRNQVLKDMERGSFPEGKPAWEDGSGREKCWGSGVSAGRGGGRPLISRRYDNF